MIARNAIGWLVAQGYILSGRRLAIARRCRDSDLIVPTLFHAPSASKLDAILAKLDRLVGIRRVDISFDDGRKEILDCIKVLEKYEVPAVIFISPGEILKGYNWAELAPHLGHGDFSRLCHLSAVERDLLFENVGPRNDLLSVDDIRRLSSHPLIEFGNHTWSHLSCACRPEAEVLDEVDRAQVQITEWTGRAPTKFSYPFGHDTPSLNAAIQSRDLTPYLLTPGLVTRQTRGSHRNMAYECYTVDENVGRLLTAWPPVSRMPV